MYRRHIICVVISYVHTLYRFISAYLQTSYIKVYIREYHSPSHRMSRVERMALYKIRNREEIRV